MLCIYLLKICVQIFTSFGFQLKDQRFHPSWSLSDVLIVLVPSAIKVNTFVSEGSCGAVPSYVAPPRWGGVFVSVPLNPLVPSPLMCKGTKFTGAMRAHNFFASQRFCPPPHLISWRHYRMHPSTSLNNCLSWEMNRVASLWTNKPNILWHTGRSGLWLLGP